MRTAAHVTSDEGRLLTICYLTDAGSPLAHRWLRHAVDRGHTVHVLSVDPLPSPIPGVTAHLLPARSRAWARRRSLRYVVALPAVRRAVSAIGPDLVHAHYAWGYGVLGALTARVPLIVSLWGSDLLVGAARSPIHAQVMRFILRRADRICATSTYLAGEAARYTDKPIVRTPFGVDCARFRPTDRAISRPVVIGIVKRLDENSGVEVLLRAHALLAGQLADPPRLLLVGATPDRRWEELAGQLGVAHLTEFRGEVPADDVPAVLREMDLYVQPSIHTESFGVAVLEAQAAGLPVVVSDLGGLPEVVLDGVTGHLVPPGDVSALASAIRRLVEDPQGMEAMAVAARDFVTSQYDWEQTAAVMDAVYASVLAEGAAR